MKEKTFIGKVALLGKGKTGSKFKELLDENNIDYIVFDSSNRPTKNELLKCTIIVSFLTGNVFEEYIDLLLDSKLPVVSGSTGVSYPINLNEKLIENKTIWITASNFSLGMNIIFNMIQSLKKAKEIFNQYNYTLIETHHTKKLDAPSGTALSWAKWLEDEVKIESIRQGDIVGIHELSLETKNEKITLSHNALDRSIFAQGAWFAVMEITSLNYGHHYFENIVRNKLG